MVKIGVACLAVIVMFSGCGKDDEEQPKEPTKDPITYDEGIVINGVKWATRNVDEVGTFATTPESYGKFYQWNRKKAWNTTDSIVSGWDSIVPEGTEWVTVNDPSPAGWRIPTFEEIKKLLDTDKVSNEWITENGVNGKKFIDKATGKSIFLPTVGYRHNVTGTLSAVGVTPGYWSRTPHESEELQAYLLGWHNNNSEPSWYGSIRSYGFSVRSVAE